MAKLKSAAQMEALRNSIAAKKDPNKSMVIICNGTGCHAHGCKAVTTAFQDYVKQLNLEDKVKMALQYLGKR